MFGFTNLFGVNTLKTLTGTPRRLALAAAAGLMLAGSTAAQAHHDDGRRDRHSPAFDVDIRIGQEPRHETVYAERQVQVWVPPTFRTVCEKRWVEPVYRTVCDKRWVEPVYRTVCEKVWVPEVCEIREVRHIDRYRTWCTRERVIVCPGHFENSERRECLAAGHFEECQRQELACAGHFEDVTRQELVCEGHYESRTERVQVAGRECHDRADVVIPLLHDLGLRIGR